MNGDRIPREGHAKPVRDSRLKSRVYAAMTGGGAGSFEGTGESRPGLGLRRMARTRPSAYGRTSRNVYDAERPRRPLADIGAIKFTALTRNSSDYSEKPQRHALSPASDPPTVSAVAAPTRLQLREHLEHLWTLVSHFSPIRANCHLIKLSIFAARLLQPDSTP